MRSIYTWGIEIGIISKNIIKFIEILTFLKQILKLRYFLRIFTNLPFKTITEYHFKIAL